MKTQISVFPWAEIGQNDHSNPYIESTAVLSDSTGKGLETRVAHVMYYVYNVHGSEIL